MDGLRKYAKRTHHRPATVAAFWAAATLLLIARSATAESIDLMLAPSVSTPHVGDPLSVDVYATMPSPLLGFGFDLLAGDALQFQRFDVSNAFVATRSRDRDGLSGLSFDGGMVGTHMLLGTAHFLPTGPGSSTISIATTPDDLSEGFARMGRGFFDVSTQAITLNVLTNAAVGGGGIGSGPAVPEPTSLLLLAVGGFLASRRLSR